MSKIKDDDVYQQSSRSIFAPGFEPVPYDTEDIRNYLQGVKVKYAHEIKPFKCIHIVFDENHLNWNELGWYAECHDLTVSHISSMENKEQPARPILDVMFYRGRDT